MEATRTRLGRPRYGLSRYLADPVLEIGPGISPFPVPKGTTRILAERPFKGSIIDLFPELGPDAIAPEGDVYLDLDTDGLRQFGPNSLGSVVVSHVLEHTANPLRAISEIHRVLRERGRTLIALPDRRLTFDRARPGTTVDHLAAEFVASIAEVADDHIIEFCIYVEGRAPGDISESLIAHHRERSIHAHCWTAEEFLAAVTYLISTNEVGFDLVDFMGVEHSIDGNNDEEFVFVFEKCSNSSVGRLLEQWAECVSSNRITEPSRLQSLATTLAQSSALFMASDRTPAEELEQLLFLWLANRDLRQFECPIVDPQPLAEWASQNSKSDDRVQSLQTRAVER